jgi:hypothetical protein
MSRRRSVCRYCECLSIGFALLLVSIPLTYFAPINWHPVPEIIILACLLAFAIAWNLLGPYLFRGATESVDGQ